MTQVLFIAALTPKPTRAGELVLHRHLVDKPEIDLHVLGTVPDNRRLSKLLRKILYYLSNTRNSRFARSLLALWKDRWIDSQLEKPADSGTPTVVMTVAHGESCYAAMRFARRNNLPLVTFYHDWWPDMAGVNDWMKKKLDRDFKALFQASDLALCVGSGMREQLGDHENAQVLYPIPSSTIVKSPPSKNDDYSNAKFRLLFAGNFGEYGEMLKSALVCFKDDPNIRLEVRGPEPDWPQKFKREMQDLGHLLPIVDLDEFEKWLSSADAFLIPMAFDVKKKRRMETSFSSKITEFSRLGKPLVVWSPKYGSAYRWANGMSSTIVSSDASPERLKKILSETVNDFQKLADLNAAASHELLDEFVPDSIQAEFLEHVEKIAR